MSRLSFVTDRTETDVMELKNIRRHILDGVATAGELTKWNSGTHKGAINTADLNRWEQALYYISVYSPNAEDRFSFTPKTWMEGEKITQTEIDRIRQGIYDARNAYYTADDGEHGTALYQKARSFLNYTASANTYKGTFNGANSFELFLKIPYDYAHENLYTFYDYIESSGTQLIRTGYTFDNTTKVKMVFKKLEDNVVSSSYADKYIQFGANNSNNEIMIAFTSGGRNYVRSSTFQAFTPSINTQYEYIIDYTKGATSLTIDGVNKGTGTVAGTNSKDILLFAAISISSSADADAFCQQRMYGVEIYNGTTLLMKLRPAKRNTDNVIGMFDQITETLYTNAGTGVFTAGNEEE